MKKSRFVMYVSLMIIIGVFITSALVYADNSTNTTTSALVYADNSTNTTTSAGTNYSSSGSSFPITNDFGTSSADQQTAISSAYRCLQNQVNNRTTNTLSLQEAVFGSLALGNVGVLQQKITASRDNANCWPSGACTIKDSAQVFLAYQRSGQSTTAVQNWLLSKNATSTDLDWYLETDIANHVASTCTIKYDTSQYTVNIADDMSLSGNPGSCFSIGQNGYWLLFRPQCYGKQVQVSCDQDFVTTLVYQKKAGDTVYVLPNTHSAAASGTTNEQVNTQCFKSGNSCDYEGSLWATLALQKAGVNIDAYIPYLLAMSDNYPQYFPSAFLYSLIGASDQYSNIIQSQQQGRFWKMIGTPYNQYYDTSLAMVALSKSSATELDNAQNYLISIQGQDGCWNNDNIRDTSFLLYAGWPKNTGGSGGSPGTSLCTAMPGQSCENSVSCLGAGGQVLSSFACTGFNVCCSVTVAQQTCAAQNGALCASNQQCSGNVIPSAESGTCCVGTCVNQQIQDTCTPAGGTCRSTCDSNEDVDNVETCSTSSEVCCMAQTTQSSGSGWTTIIIIVILIILVILAIIFRNQLKLWWFKFRGKAKSSPVVRPGTPPSGAYRIQPTFRPRPMPTQRVEPARMPPSRRQPISEKDKELDETLRKLREISK